MKFILLILLCSFFDSFYAVASTEEIKLELHHKMLTDHQPITYKDANLILFTKLDNHNGFVCSVYSPGDCLQTDIVPSPKLMNIEHTWPQSNGANGDAKSDLHHLFITSSSTNSIRSSLPFCEVEVIKWSNDHSKRGISHFNEHCFEPPLSHRGNIARALFYFSIRYLHEIDQIQEFYLRKWNLEDPVDENEQNRNNQIQLYQHNLNPFILNPKLADQITDF
jgi:deoxyribonuclease-1